MNDKITFKNVSLNLTAEALEYLCGTTAGTANIIFFKDLLSRMTDTKTTVLKRGISIEIRPGQADASMLSMARSWGVGRKVALGIFTAMERHGIIRRNSDNITSLIDMVCVSGWYADGYFHKNPLYTYASNPVSRP